MAIQQGFTAGQDAQPLENTGNPLYAGTTVFRISHKVGDNPQHPENVKMVTLLDDNPAWCYRHYIKQIVFDSKNWRIRDVRVTCADSSSNKPSPRKCLICEAAMRHGEVLKRKFTANLTLIDEGLHVSKKTNKQYYDLKKRLELDYGYFKVFEEMKSGAPSGTLAGVQFKVMRPAGDPKQTKTFGNLWTPQNGGQPTNPYQRFYQSPAIRAIMENSQKRGNALSQEEAVQQNISPIDYAKEVDNYSPELAEMFIMSAVAKDYTASAGQQQQQPSFNGGPNSPPGYGGHGQGGYQPQDQQQQYGGAMPTGQVPDYSTGQQQPAPQQQQQQMAPAPQQLAPPPVANPPQSVAPPSQPALAPASQQQQQPLGSPPWDTGHPSTQPQQPVAPPSRPDSQQQADQYDFQSQPGWSGSFPGQQQPAPQQQQQQQQQQQPTVPAPAPTPTAPTAPMAVPPPADLPF